MLPSRVTAGQLRTNQVHVSLERFVMGYDNLASMIRLLLIHCLTASCVVIGACQRPLASTQKQVEEAPAIGHR